MLKGIHHEVQKYLPDLLFVIDVNRESIGVVEANRLGIPIIAIVAAIVSFITPR